MNVGRMLQVAAKASRPSKAECMTILKELAEELGEEKLVQIASLYSWFTPAAPGVTKAKKDAFAWCATAVASRDSRSFLQYVFVSSAGIYGSNGHRIHSAPRPEGLEEGLYNPKTGEKVWDLWENYTGARPTDHPGKYPDLREAIARAIGDDQVDVPFEQLTNPENRDTPVCTAARIDAPEGGRSVWLNLIYWQQASLNAVPGDVLSIHRTESEKRAVMLRLAAFGGSTAVVMPTIL